jgi:transposase
VPDNLKVGVTHASYYDPVINASYAALIKHYGTAVVPARARKPRDKAKASYCTLFG